MTELPTVKSLEKAFELLELVAQFPEGIPLVDICAKTGINKTTAYRMLMSLVNLGYLQKNEQNLYTLTLKMFYLSGETINNLDVLSIARLYMQELSDHTHETINLVVQDNIDIVYIHIIQGNNAVRTHAHLGMRAPMYCSAVGKCILAHMTLKEIKHVWDNSVIEKRAANTIIEFSDLLDDLERTKINGYAIDNEENEPGISCIAVPLINYSNRPVGALSIAAPTYRLGKEQANDFVKDLYSVGKKISFQLGGQNCSWYK